MRGDRADRRRRRHWTDRLHQAVLTAAGRGYRIQLYTGDGAPGTYDMAWFEEVLATVQLHPEDAAD